MKKKATKPLTSERGDAQALSCRWDSEIGSSTECSKNGTGNASAFPPLVFEFDPGQIVSIIRRKAMIKELAASYHAECLSYCQELLELQGKWEQRK
eukprot:Gb_21549 [translate_table: standard]